MCIVVQTEILNTDRIRHDDQHQVQHNLRKLDLEATTRRRTLYPYVIVCCILGCLYGIRLCVHFCLNGDSEHRPYQVKDAQRRVELKATSGRPCMIM